VTWPPDTHQDVEDAVTELRDSHWSAPTVPLADYTLVLGDEGGIVAMDVATDSTLTVPPNASVDFQQGATIWVIQADTGLITITPGAGVVLRTPDGRDPITRGQFSVLVLRQAAVDTWYVTGDVMWTDTTFDTAIEASTATAVDFAPIDLEYDGTQWPVRPSTSGTNRRVYWWGPSADPVPTTGTASGGTRAAAPGDRVFLS
jgi:hypothetical protein